MDFRVRRLSELGLRKEYETARDAAHVLTVVGTFSLAATLLIYYAVRQPGDPETWDFAMGFIWVWVRSLTVVFGILELCFACVFFARARRLRSQPYA